MSASWILMSASWILLGVIATALFVFAFYLSGKDKRL